MKLGDAIFDILHALGLALVLAVLNQSPIHLEDRGTHYRLTGPAFKYPKHPPLTDFLPLPTIDRLKAFDPIKDVLELPFLVLDGLLAALFTIPGPRTVSLHDLAGKEEPDLPKVLGKATKYITSRQTYLNRVAKKHSGWLAHALAQQYDLVNLVVPVLAHKHGIALSVLMTTGPSCSFSLSSPFSGGQSQERKNITVKNTIYALVLVLIAASRWLRAQRVAKNKVIFYVPAFSTITITPETVLPSLPASRLASDLAVLSYWLSLALVNVSPDQSVITGFHYQILQTQGISQSISIGRGYLDCQWLTALAGDNRRLLKKWRRWLGLAPAEQPAGIANLVDLLLHRRPGAWREHLRELAAAYSPKHLPYSIEEVWQVSKVLDNENELLEILNSDSGTLRFGRALRHLIEFRRARGLDILDQLSTVHDLKQFYDSVARLVQACTIAKAKSPIIIVPGDDDYNLLLADVQRFGLVNVVGNLRVIAWLRYPHRESSSQTHTDSDSHTDMKGEVSNGNL